MATRVGFSSFDLEELVLGKGVTVTEVLESLTGEMVVADVVRQVPMTVETDVDLDVARGEKLTHRLAVLIGCTTNRAYLVAESIYVAERLPVYVRDRLEQTNDPIGRVLVEYGATLERQPLLWLQRPEPVPPDVVTEFSSQVVWSRTYRLLVDARPMFVIREWFLRSMLDAVDQRSL